MRHPFLATSKSRIHVSNAIYLTQSYFFAAQLADSMTSFMPDGAMTVRFEYASLNGKDRQSPPRRAPNP